MGPQGSKDATRLLPPLRASLAKLEIGLGSALSTMRTVRGSLLWQKELVTEAQSQDSVFGEKYINIRPHSFDSISSIFSANIISLIWSGYD